MGTTANSTKCDYVLTSSADSTTISNTIAVPSTNTYHFNGNNWQFHSNNINNNYNNTDKMKQVKIAIFQVVERDEINKIKRVEHIKEAWLDVQPGTDIGLLVAKQLDKEYEPNDIVFKEVYTFTF